LLFWNARASYDPSVMRPAVYLLIALCTFAVVGLGAAGLGYIIHQAVGEPWGAIVAFGTFALVMDRIDKQYGPS
jgi:hypothetical protein